MDTTGSFRARFRFRVQKVLDIKANSHRFKVGAQAVDLSAERDDELISESNWLVMNTRGFETEQDARAFALRLKAAVEISSVATRLGIDSGVDLATSGLGQAVRDHFREEHGVLVRDNIHGIDVFSDAGDVRIFSFRGSGTVRAQPDPFLSDLSALIDIVGNESKNTKDVVLLLNYALMRTDPVAQIVFSISAVEMLGHQEVWSTEQRLLIDKLASAATAIEIGTEDERREVATAIKIGLHKVSLRQGVLRLLTSLGLNHLKNDWDKLYGQRSTLVHGLAPKPGSDYGQLAFDSVSLCGEVLLAVIAKEIPPALQHVARYKLS